MSKKTKTKLAFMLHDDQVEVVNAALQKAKGETGSVFDAVALEAIAQSYLGAGIQFKSWNEALTYAAKHSDDPAAFMKAVIDSLKSMCPDSMITVEIAVKEQPAA